MKKYSKGQILQCKDFDEIIGRVWKVYILRNNMKILIDTKEKVRDQANARKINIMIQTTKFNNHLFYYALFYVLFKILKMYKCITLLMLKGLQHNNKISKRNINYCIINNNVQKIDDIEDHGRIWSSVGNIYLNKDNFQIIDDYDEYKNKHLEIRTITYKRSTFSILFYLLYIFYLSSNALYFILSRFLLSMEEVTGNKPCGLRNTNETCYMNSMMQALASSSKLIRNLTKWMSETNCNQNYQMFLDTLKFINENNDIVAATNKLLLFMRKVQWTRSSQQDAFQLLSFFINFIQKDSGLSKNTMPPKFKILHAFSEDSKYNKVQDHLALALPLCGTYKELPGESLECLIDDFFKPSIIDEGPSSTQLYLFEEAPEVMIIHIQANEWDYDLGAYVKPKYYIKYEEELKYTFTIQKKVDGSEEVPMKVTYQLRAVVHHMGSISGGHYITYRRHGPRWYLTNDTQVEEVSFKYDVVPYIMVYEKKRYN